MFILALCMSQQKNGFHLHTRDLELMGTWGTFLPTPPISLLGCEAAVAGTAALLASALRASQRVRSVNRALTGPRHRPETESTV